MCGLLYARNTATDRENRPIYHSVSKRIMKQYYNQKERGVDGFGIYDGERKHLIKETTERRIIRWLRTHKSSEILFHHRIPTSTENVKNAAHPFSTGDFFGDTEYIFIHNGIIQNSYSLMRLHNFRYPTIKYTSEQLNGDFNDSEALMWDIALTLEGIQDKPNAYGSVAFICIEKHKDDPNKNKLHYYRNEGHPLYKVGNKKTEVIVSKPSKDQKQEMLEPNVLHSYDYTTRVEAKRHFEVPLVSSHKTSKPEMMKALPANVIDEAREDNPYISYMKKKEEQTPLERSQDFVKDASDSGTENQTLESDYIQQSKFYNDLKDLRADYNAIVMEYLNDVEGRYYAAIQNMKDRLTQCHKLPFSIGNWKEIMLLEGGIAILVQDPFWDTEDALAQAHEWVDSPTEEDAVQTILPLKEQTFADHIVEKVRQTTERLKEEVAESSEDLQTSFYTPINSDTVGEILGSDEDSGTREPDGPTIVAEVIPKSRFMNMFNKKHKIEEVPSLITEIPREELA